MSYPSLICIIDDDEIYLFYMQRLLENLAPDARLIVFFEAEAGLQFLEDHSDQPAELPDLLLLDINMPVMDGFQFLEEYGRLHPRLSKEIIIHISSSSVDPTDLRRAKQNPFVAGYLVKEITAQKLQTLLESL